MGSVEIVDFRFNNELKKIGINNLISTNGASEYLIKGKEEFKLNFLDLTNHPVGVAQALIIAFLGTILVFIYMYLNRKFIRSDG